MNTAQPGNNKPKTDAVEELNWKLLQYFNAYRLAIAALAASVAVFAGALPPFGSSDPALFFYASLTYLVVSLFGLQITRVQQPDFETQASVFSFADITFITLLMHASGGLSSGLGLFLIIAVAGASLMLGKQMTIFLAALASIAALLQHGWGWFTGATASITAISDGFPQVGILGIGLFLSARLGYALAQRLQLSEALAESRGIDLANLTQLNEMIIRRMQSGVIVCDVNGQISISNEQTNAFLGLVTDNATEKETIAELAPELADALNQWKEFPNATLQKPFRSRTGYMLLPRFELLGDTPGSGILIFLDDAAILKQQAQQLKMAALARLTASIAHEIRNPLGAISNAAQLLSESAEHQSQDGRLIEIIQDHSRRMNAIIENITQLARRDRVSLVRLNVYPWLEELRRQYATQVNISGNAINLSGDESTMACVDPDQLYQVVVNLCQNSLRHCPEYTDKALIQLTLSTNNDGLPILDVSDIGPGIKDEIVENIFDPFFTTAANGTGLGLYISRELCEGNSGRLEYVPGNEIGARFRITFARASACGTVN